MHADTSVEFFRNITFGIDIEIKLEMDSVSNNIELFNCSNYGCEKSYKTKNALLKHMKLCKSLAKKGKATTKIDCEAFVVTENGQYV